MPRSASRSRRSGGTFQRAGPSAATSPARSRSRRRRASPCASPPAEAIDGEDAAAGAGGLGDLPVRGTDGRLGRRCERNEIAHAHGLRAPRVERDVVRAPRGRLDHRVERPLELIGQALAGHAARDDRRRHSRARAAAPLPAEPRRSARGRLARPRGSAAGCRRASRDPGAASANPRQASTTFSRRARRAAAPRDARGAR